jgi:hypothetical protein
VYYSISTDNFYLLSRLCLCVTYKAGSGLNDWIYWHLIHTARDYRQLQHYHWSTHFTVHRWTRTMISVSTSRILATDLSHMKSSCHSLIPFLLFLLSHLRLPSPELDPFLNNNWLNWTLLQVNSLNFWRQLKRPSLTFYNTSTRTTQKTQPLYCSESLFTDLLPCSGRPIVTRVGSRGNVLTESLPSNGSIHHTINSF